MAVDPLPLRLYSVDVSESGEGSATTRKEVTLKPLTQMSACYCIGFFNQHLLGCFCAGTLG